MLGAVQRDLNGVIGRGLAYIGNPNRRMAPTPSGAGSPSRSSSATVKAPHSFHRVASATSDHTTSIGASTWRVTMTVRRLIASS